LLAETRSSRANTLRASLGLAVPEPKAPTAATVAPTPRAPKAAPAPKREIPTKMPKPEFVRPPPRAAAPPPKRYPHPKFGEGVLETQTGEGPDAKLTIKFPGGSKTLLARFVTEATTEAAETKV